MCKLNKSHGKVNINSLSIETALNFDDLIHRRTGQVGEGSPPKFWASQEKIWVKPVFKDISMLFYYFEEINISDFNLKLA